MSKTAVARKTAETELPKSSVIESVIVKGDLSRLNEAERVQYYNGVCESLGLNPYTRPFEYIVLNGRLTLYARKDAADQLRKIYSVSILPPQVQYVDDLIIVSVSARMPDGREDADVGVVTLGNLRGDARANAIMKAITKAKRRVTLSICGLGFLDETEVETVPDARPAPQYSEPAPVQEPAPAPQKERDLDRVLAQLRKRFTEGEEIFHRAIDGAYEYVDGWPDAERTDALEAIESLVSELMPAEESIDEAPRLAA